MKKNLLGLALFTSLGAAPAAQQPASTAQAQKNESIVTQQQKVTIPAPQKQNSPQTELKSIGDIPKRERQASFELLTSEDMFKIALQKDPVVVVKFVADWSSASKDTTVDHKILEKYRNMVTFYTYTFVEKSTMALKWGVSGVPFYIGFKKGNHVRSKAQMDEQEFEDFIATIRNEPEPTAPKAPTKK